MALICYHASHEQFSPSQLLQLVQQAEAAGFNGIHSSDHFHPWSKRQGQSGFSFSWIAAALQATKIPFSMVCAPGQRYHPAIVAQAIATLAEMFPQRIDFELGSGEALNETITGAEWPSKAVRNERLLQCVLVIRKLLRGEETEFDGYVKVKHARLFTLPSCSPLLLCAAISANTAGWAGSWADGLLTTAESDPQKTMAKIAAFRKNGGMGKPVFLQYGFSYARSAKDAEEGAFDQWRSTILPREQLASFHKVEDFDTAGEHISMNEVLDAVPVFTRMYSLRQKVSELEGLGADRIILHNINRLQETFLEDFRVSFL